MNGAIEESSHVINALSIFLAAREVEQKHVSYVTTGVKLAKKPERRL